MGSRRLVLVICVVATALVVLGAPSAGAAPDRLWASRFDSPAQAGDFGQSVAVTPDGSTVIATGPSNGDYMTIAYNAATGQRLWRVKYDGPDHGSDLPYRVAVTPDGSTAVVAGTSATATSTFGAIATVAYDTANGSVRWSARYSAPVAPLAASNDGWGLAISPDGSTAVVTGDSVGEKSGQFSMDFVTIAYAIATGENVWTRRYDGPAGGSDAAVAAVFTRGSATVVVTGFSDSGDDSGYDDVTIAYDAGTGATQWTRRRSTLGRHGDQIPTLVASHDGATVIAIGVSGSRMMTVAYDAETGTRKWGHDDDADPMWFNSAAASVDGTVAVTGKAPGDQGGYVTVAYDIATGTRLWSRTYHGPAGGPDTPRGVAATPDGSAFIVAGVSAGATSGNDMVTVSYDATSGTKLWARRYNGPANGDDAGSSIAVAPTGAAAFVTGWSAGDGTGNDFVTVAYPLT